MQLRQISFLKVCPRRFPLALKSSPKKVSLLLISHPDGFSQVNGLLGRVHSKQNNGPSFFFFLAAPCGTQNLSSPGIQPVPPSMEAGSLNHWTIREVLTVPHFKKGLLWLFPLSRFTSNTASRILATRKDSVFHNKCSKLYSQRRVFSTKVHGCLFFQSPEYVI